MNQDDVVSVLRYKANRLRTHSIRSTTEAGSGHPTSCLSAADIVSALFFHVMRHDPKNPENPANDRFIMSKGHAAPLLYAAWAEAGVIPPERLLTLRRIDSELEGHPTPRFKWVDVATGSLGQGLSVGLGMALSARLDKLHCRVYVLMGDGESAEGGVWEAAALAAYYRLNNLVGIVDVNGLGQSQRTMYGFDTASYRRRFAAFGWHAVEIDGHDMSQILSALDEARKVEDRPTVIVARTLKGKGVSFLEDKEGFHGKALSKEEAEKALVELKLDGAEPKLRIEPPAKSGALSRSSFKEMAPPSYKIGDKVATREAYGAALAKLGDVNPMVVALDGETKNSTFAEKFAKSHPDRYFEGFIAEQNMVGAAVGLSARGKIPFVSTFSAFLTRAYDHIRMSAISRANVKYVGSHCGVSIGEDGPSQMGLEDLAMMRAIPGSVVLYPSDAVSAEKLVAEAAKHRGVVFIRTSRPKTPVIYENGEDFKIGGSKVLRSSGQDRVTIVAAGVTLSESLKAYDQLKKEGVPVRVIDAYSVKPIDRDALLRAASEAGRTIITVEDHYPEGGLGEAVMSALASDGVKVYKLAVSDVPRSGKPEELLDAFGISARCIADKVRSVLKSF
jgi:transketolase